MTEALHATVVEVRKNKTGEGSTKIILEVPMEYYKACAQWDDARVLVTRTAIDAPFGPLRSETA